jgi:hypothetical protein
VTQKWQILNHAPVEDPVWWVAPFIDIPGEHPGKRYEFEWEREWRHVGNFPFKVDEVDFLIIPEAEHQEAREYFRVAQEEQLGPNYCCPY